MELVIHILFTILFIILIPAFYCLGCFSIRRKESIPTGGCAFVVNGDVGIGRAICLELANRGVKIVICSEQTRRLQSMENEIALFGGECIALKSTCSDLADVRELTMRANDRFGGIDYLILNFDDPDAVTWKRTSFVYELAETAITYIKQTKGRIMSLSPGYSVKSIHNTIPVVVLGLGYEHGLSATHVVVDRNNIDSTKHCISAMMEGKSVYFCSRSFRLSEALKRLNMAISLFLWFIVSRNK